MDKSQMNYHKRQSKKMFLTFLTKSNSKYCNGQKLNELSQEAMLKTICNTFDKNNLKHFQRQKSNELLQKATLKLFVTLLTNKK